MSACHSPRPPSRHCAARAAAGFTLVEVLVALFILAILAGMAWQGIDGLIRVRDGAQRSTERSLQLATVVAQWELDLNQVQQSAGAPPLRFDGASLQLTRRTPDGLQLVVWTLQSGTLYRWASPPVTRMQALQEWWLRGQQWSTLQPTALPMITELNQWQVYYYRQGDNAWSNAQSSGNRPQQSAAPAAPASGASAPDDAETSESDEVPQGVRLVLSLPAGSLSRDVMLQGAL